ncbi:hypothetical protein [Desulfitobacterium metallireducens]|uniref:Uncharacterized protein n=1 Tax=Desulfitobacterium metallireducens DSM 15288 TaxID=871968 RepID=W0EB08_9FIRM|nr:hypothetical protein [Desulfitobacterium metallireducens]AHF06231.1 hypothetical protein DESME_03540 [Desulfitobacterium metallireducens DSM 15288]
MKRTGEIQRKPKGPDSAKYESRSVSDKQEQKKKNDPNTLEQS